MFKTTLSAIVMRYSAFIFIIASLLFLAASNAFKLESFSAEIAEENRSTVRLKWVVSSDQEVASYILWRQTSDQTTRNQIQEIEVRPGAEPRKTYSFDDNTLYKMNSGASQQVTYFIQVKMKGSGQIIEPLNNQTKLSYTSTTARRTWGSIKAMFQ
jgi:hypothetical protein